MPARIDRMGALAAMAIFLVLVVVPVVPIEAHHSISAEFDVNQPIQFEGVVKQVAWLNPHIYTHVEMTREDGSTVVYRVEGSAPNSLYRRGWRPDTLVAGQKVTVEGIRAKNPESFNIGRASIVTENGVTAFSGDAPE